MLAHSSRAGFHPVIAQRLPPRLVRFGRSVRSINVRMGCWSSTPSQRGAGWSVRDGGCPLEPVALFVIVRSLCVTLVNWWDQQTAATVATLVCRQFRHH
jgi:hypothetical protein